MEIIKINNYPIAANTYIAYDENTTKGVIIDPSFGIANAVNSVIEEGIEVSAILLTHGHFDHIAGVESVRTALGIPVYIHAADADMLLSADKNHASFYGLDIATSAAENIIEDGQIIDIEGLSFKVMHTPGHTKGSVCYISGDIMFTGDTLFYMSMGRTDLEGGDYAEMMASLKKLSELNVDYKVYPGHEQSTSLFYEKDNNPFMSV